MTDATQRLIEAAQAALETAKNGLLWYHGMYPMEVNSSDDEAIEEIDAALAALAAARQQAKTRGRLGKRFPWGWVYKAADGDLVWHEGCARPDGSRWYPMYSLDTDEFPVDRQEAAAPEVRAAEPVAWQWQHLIGNPGVYEPFWTEWAFCTKREYEYALAMPDWQARALCVCEPTPPKETP